jgi:hypothetical protein
MLVAGVAFTDGCRAASGWKLLTSIVYRGKSQEGFQKIAVLAKSQLVHRRFSAKPQADPGAATIV